MIKTTSLELSKQLKEAGFLQDTGWFYIASDTSEGYELYFKCPNNEYWFNPEREAVYHLYISDIIAAPTAEEILERLPIQIEKIGFISILKFQTWWVGYGQGSNEYVHKDNEVLAEAAGKMYLYLEKNNLLAPITGKDGVDR